MPFYISEPLMKNTFKKHADPTARKEVDALNRSAAVADKPTACVANADRVLIPTVMDTATAII